MNMLRDKDGGLLTSDWLGKRNTVAFLGIWERIYIYHPYFNSREFTTIKRLRGMHRYRLSVKEGARGGAMYAGPSLQRKWGRVAVPQSPNFGGSPLQ